MRRSRCQVCRVCAGVEVRQARLSLVAAIGTDDVGLVRLFLP